MIEWKPCPGYEDIYEVSNVGSVRRIRPVQGSRSGYVLKGLLDGRGYRTYTLRKNGLFRSEKAHRLVCIAFNGNPVGGRVYVNHKDGNRENNTTENLEWVTHRENVQHAYASGLVDLTNRRGDRHPKARAVIRRANDGSEARFNTIKDAVTATPKASRTGVWHGVTGRYSRHAGFVWAYA